MKKLSEQRSLTPRKTISDYPAMMKAAQLVFGSGFRLVGWQFSETPPTPGKYVLIIAPHTSNWDFFLMISVAASLGRQVRFMGKHSIFMGPLGWLLRSLGGVPVERGSHHNFVAQMVDLFAQTDDMVLIIAPEGTRSKVAQWKGGFYYMAHGAAVPIVPVCLDFAKKQVYFADPFMPTGQYADDIVKIQSAYHHVSACHPEQDSSHPSKNNENVCG
jgi:1-acyl-sn-glycerol-3-phosphate acyltransferase